MSLRHGHHIQWAMKYARQEGWPVTARTRWTMSKIYPVRKKEDEEVAAVLLLSELEISHITIIIIILNAVFYISFLFTSTLRTNLLWRPPPQHEIYGTEKCLPPSA